jgi:hypothetical protein
MKLTEIEKIGQREFPSLVKTAIPRQWLNDLQPLPGGSGFFYYTNDSKNQIFLITPDKGHIIGRLGLDRFPTFPESGAAQVDTISLDPQYRKNRLGLALYGIILTIMGRTLLAGTAQTPRGRQMWVNLWNLQGRVPGLEIRGFITLMDDYRGYDYIRDRDFDIIYGLLGAEYLGETIGVRDNKLHTFAFDVRPNVTGLELESTVESKLSQIYNNKELSPNQIGIFAKVNR